MLILTSIPSRERKRAVAQSATILCLAGILFFAGAVAQAQQAGIPAASQTVIRTETRLVLVDTVVTDKKGVYIHGASGYLVASGAMSRPPQWK